MNYDEARQRQSPDGTSLGLWDWTTMNDGKVRRAAPCTEDCKHKSETDASRHFYEYCLSQAKRHEHPDEKRRCVICGEWTTLTFGNHQLWLTCREEWLCEQHASPEGLRQALPFVGPIRVIHS